MLQRYFEALALATTIGEERDELVIRIEEPPVFPMGVLEPFVRSLHPTDAMSMANDYRKVAFGQEIARLLRNDDIWKQWYLNELPEIQNVFPTWKHAYLWVYGALRRLVKTEVGSMSARNRSGKSMSLYSTMKLNKLLNVHIEYKLGRTELFDTVNIPLLKFLNTPSLQSFVVASEKEFWRYGETTRIILHFVQGPQGIAESYDYAEAVKNAYSDQNYDEFKRLTGYDLEEIESTLRDNASRESIRRYQDSDDYADRLNKELSKRFDFLSGFKYFDLEYGHARFIRENFERDGRLNQNARELFQDFPRNAGPGTNILLAGEIQ